MKRCFYSMMAAMALLLLSACSSDDELSQGNGNEALVSFNVELSGGMQNKAISDGTTAKNLTVHVFDENGTYLSELDKTVELNEKKKSVSINLVKGKTYSFLFWASVNKENSPYSFGVDGKTITVDYNDAKANDESRDAFLGVVKNKAVEASFEENVTLKRPFAQINFLTDDIADAGKNGLTIDENTHSSITLSKVATTLNPFTNTVGGFTEAEVIFGEAAIPALSETVTMGSAPDAKTYNYLGTAYFLVPAEGENPNAGKDQAMLNSATLKIKDINGEGLKVENVPVQWNYRTNIYGSLLTATGNFNVTIVPDYDGSHNQEVKTKQVTTVDQVDEAIQSGATEVIVTEAPKKDATITIPKVFEQDNETAVSISIPATTAAITIEEDTQEVQSAPKEVTITAPTTSNLTINLPNSTVTLNGESYTTMTATTADNTLIIPEGVKVENLTVNRGNVEIYGDLAVKVAKGSGYKGTIIYFISTVEQLRALATEVNGGTTFSGMQIKLSNDIDLKSEEWTPIGRKDKAFQGTFDGCGYTISNLKIERGVNNSSSNADMGLFGFTSDGKVMNFTLYNAFVKAGIDVGAIAGTPYTSSYSNITLAGDVKVEGYSYVGGMFGKNVYKGMENLTVRVNEGSYVKAESETYRTYVGGVIGFMGEGNIIISNVESNINVTGSTCDVGGITGIAHYGNTFENCICTGNVTLVNANDAGDQLEIGGIAGVWMNSSAGKVTLRKCNFTGTLKSALNGVDKSEEVAGNRLTGRKYYPNSNEGELIIE
ncbi:FimB/Mfa2 family fimbrial subunit [Parabacteroides distasonis]|uniref:FimB/Mfa2 family fimbrial subunit n=1 Tax=Parabacteroides distasonis TaxID=823 RepID=UPI001F25A0CB|nr:FimB/Mfa2 family fimbrial subunit [Parabacteroides distasonis]MCE9355646.1 FimB/Mfa2 family fimbrial subunit [Parabacteroides distasonis]